MAAGDRETAENGRAEGASDSRRDPLIGAVVNGKYRVESAIARGGMGRIYYATQVPLERAVALKVVQADGDHEHESQFLKRFLQEASILAKLQHPNVVTLFDYGKIEGSHVEQYFIAMEFLAGETLTHRLKTRGRLTVPESLVLTRQIVRGLREAHKRGVVHRDLKPSNIILVPEGDGSELVKLVDFGIGKVLGRPGDAQDLTQDGVFVGTPRYMAPEQFEGAAYPASDLYALGTILFQAIAGRLPFDGSTMAEFMVAKLARGVPTIREVAPDVHVPDGLEALVRHLLARRPEERPSMEELHAHLMACEEEVFGTPHSMRRGNSSGPHAFASTGTGPSMREPTPRPFGAHEQLRVPHTVVAPIPNVAHLTPHPMAASARPIAEPSRSKVPLFVVLALLVTAGVGAGAYVKLKPQPVVTITAPTTTTPETAATSTPSSAAFTLTIESVPPGATVSEGENTLGETPLKIAVDRASVSSAPRTFVVMKTGFAPSHVVQGPSSDSVTSMVSLAPLAAEAASAVKSRPANGGRPGAQAAGTAPKATATAAQPANGANGNGLDIRLKR